MREQPLKRYRPHICTVMEQNGKQVKKSTGKNVNAGLSQKNHYINSHGLLTVRQPKKLSG